MSKRRLGIDQNPHRNRNFVLVSAALFLGLGIIGAIVGIVGTPPQEPQANTAAVEAPRVREIVASVRFTGTQFEIINPENRDWINVRFELNSGLFSSGYTLKVRLIEALTTYIVGAMQFTNSKGERFNPYQMKPQNFCILDFSSRWPEQAGMEGMVSFEW